MSQQTDFPTPAVRWQKWYPFVSRQLLRDSVLFLNYGFETEPPMDLALNPDEEPDRVCVNFYHFLASQTPLEGRKVLEVSCGHGGGASYIKRTFRPAQYTGLDVNPRGIRFCQTRHATDGLDFVEGDATNLPLAGDSRDVVINLEASHCYPDFPRFLEEVARVLKPGGVFLYSDFRFAGEIAQWESDLAAAPMTLTRQTLLDDEVLRGMTKKHDRATDLVRRHLPESLHALGNDFGGVNGSRTHTALISGQMTYRLYSFTKQPA